MESHNVTTSDGYILGMFRIPYSPKLKNRNSKKRVAFLMHGFISSSDCWILSGPDNALAYILADAGYDVWLGNARGNAYAKNHNTIKGFIERNIPSFWNFSWDEIANIDLPSMFEYVMKTTKETDLHYIGHSQGTTVYFALLASQPKYNQIIRTGQLLAPVVYMANMESPFRLLAPFLGNTPIISNLIGNYQFLPKTELLAMFGYYACRDGKVTLQDVCANTIFLLTGFDAANLNYVSNRCRFQVYY